MPRPAVDALLLRAEKEISSGRLPSCQLALAHGGRVIVEATLGAATPESRYCVFSVTKAAVAGAVWLLLGEKQLSPATRVIAVVPDFATNGKDAVTLEHLLTHTAGFPRAPIRAEDGATRDGRRKRFAQWRLDTPPGTATEYSTVSYHWVIAELIERVTGQNYRSYVNSRVLDPLGLTDLRLGVPEGEQGDIVEVSVIASEGPPRTGLPDASGEQEFTLLYNQPHVRAIGVPGSGAVGRAGDVALLYQAMLHNTGGLWDPTVLADGTGNIRNALEDPWIRVPANRTLGLVVAGEGDAASLRQFGRGVGPRAFGASGIGGQIAWADPDSGLSFCYLTNGIEADPVQSFLRADAVSTLATACVPGAGPDDASESGP